MMQPQDIPAAIQRNIINIVVIIISLIIAKNIFTKQMAQVGSIRSEADIARQKNAMLEQIVQSEKRLKNLRRSINKEETSIINTINTIAKKFDVKIVELKPVPEQKITGYVKYPFVLNIAVNNYHTLGRFISALESDPFLFTVDSMSVNIDESGDSRKYKLRVNLETNTILIKD
jgi:Tfp pilus assembly protein PilO